ncbi:TPA: hypothetical protein ACMDRM_001680 [Vibrio cholerae]
MTKTPEKQTYVVLVPFMHGNEKQVVDKTLDLTARQAANLLAGGFIGKPAAKAAKTTAKSAE